MRNITIFLALAILPLNANLLAASRFDVTEMGVKVHQTLAPQMYWSLAIQDFDASLKVAGKLIDLNHQAQDSASTADSIVLKDAFRLKKLIPAELSKGKVTYAMIDTLLHGTDYIGFLCKREQYTQRLLVLIDRYKRNNSESAAILSIEINLAYAIKDTSRMTAAFIDLLAEHRNNLIAQRRYGELLQWTKETYAEPVGSEVVDTLLSCAANEQVNTPSKALPYLDRLQRKVMRNTDPWPSMEKSPANDQAPNISCRKLLGRLIENTLQYGTKWLPRYSDAYCTSSTN